VKGEIMAIKETVNKAITRYYTKDGKEISEEAYHKLQELEDRRKRAKKATAES
jgi:NAD-dependent DNA ligase